MKLKRAYSPNEVLNMKIPCFEFSGAWYDSMGNPAKSGTWIIWGGQWKRQNIICNAVGQVSLFFR